VSDALLALALPALPDLDRDAAMLLTVVVALATVVIVGRAILGAASLRAGARAADRLTERLEASLPTLEQRMAGVRSGLNEVNVATERMLWALPAVDRRLAIGSGQLASLRAELDAWRGPSDESLGHRVTGIRGTLRAMRAALRLRRMIQR
jgi:hypothetical protein